MKKRDPQELNSFFYDEEGTNQVMEQIMDSYNSGVVGEQNVSNLQSEEQTE